MTKSTTPGAARSRPDHQGKALAWGRVEGTRPVTWMAVLLLGLIGMVRASNSDLGDFAPLKVGHSWTYERIVSSSSRFHDAKGSGHRFISVQSRLVQGTTIWYGLQIKDSTHYTNPRYPAQGIEKWDTVSSFRVWVQEMEDGSLFLSQDSTTSSDSDGMLHQAFLKHAYPDSLVYPGNPSPTVVLPIDFRFPSRYRLDWTGTAIHKQEIGLWIYQAEYSDYLGQDKAHYRLQDFNGTRFNPAVATEREAAGGESGRPEARVRSHGAWDIRLRSVHRNLLGRLSR